MNIQIRREGKRGCGWRKGGGLYLVSGHLAKECGKLPIALIVCPTCGSGIKPSRGWTWINATQLLEGIKCKFEGTVDCAVCPMSKPMGRVGLIWIGEKFYATPAEFGREASMQGVSRRISTVPRDFKLGETWVLLAHRKAISNPDGSFTPGIFHAFKPIAIEYVVKGNESEEELERLAKRDITLVKIEKIGETKPIFEKVN